jgi:hypothetical protein
MPLHPHGYDLLRANLEGIGERQKVRAVLVGVLTASQVSAINSTRLLQGLSPIISEVLFVGGHIYKSRILRDGYTIEDVIDQISNAMEDTAIVLEAIHMTAMENPLPRADRYGNFVIDRVIFECSTRHPRPELFSVIPRGDIIKPTK